MSELVRTPGVKPTKTSEIGARMRRGLLAMLQSRLEDVDWQLHGSACVKESYGVLKGLMEQQEGRVRIALDEAVGAYASDLVWQSFLRGVRDGIALAQELSGSALAAVAAVPLFLDCPFPDDFELAEFGIAAQSSWSYESSERRPGSTAAVPVDDDAEAPTGPRFPPTARCGGDENGRKRRRNREGSALNPTPALPGRWVQTHLGPGRLFSVCDETVTVEMDWTYLVEFPRAAVILVKEGPR